MFQTNINSIVKTLLLSTTLVAFGSQVALAKNNNKNSDDDDFTTSNSISNNSGNHNVQIKPTININQGNTSNSLDLSNIFKAPTTPAFSKEASVDFKKDEIQVPCLLITGLDGSNINNTYYNVKLTAQFPFNASFWVVSSATPEPKCTPISSSTNPFQTQSNSTSATVTPPPLSDAKAIRNYQTAYVDFKKEVFEIPCLVIKNFADKSYNDTFYHVGMLTKAPSDFMDWKVDKAEAAPTCKVATPSTNPFAAATGN